MQRKSRIPSLPGNKCNDLPCRTHRNTKHFRSSVRTYQLHAQLNLRALQRPSQRIAMLIPANLVEKYRCLLLLSCESSFIDGGT